MNDNNKKVYSTTDLLNYLCTYLKQIKTKDGEVIVLSSLNLPLAVEFHMLSQKAKLLAFLEMLNVREFYKAGEEPPDYRSFTASCWLNTLCRYTKANEQSLQALRGILESTQLDLDSVGWSPEDILFDEK
jgi:hypothetical protein